MGKTVFASDGTTIMGHYSERDYGPTMRLPVAPPITFTLISGIASEPPPIEAITLRKVGYISDYPWSWTESFLTYLKREVRTMLIDIWDDDGRRYMFELIKSQYPKTARIIVHPAPAWIYRPING